MAEWTEDIEQRMESPTPLRLEEARRRGIVARSSDLTAAVLVLSAAGMLALAGPGLLEDLKAMLATMIGQAGVIHGTDRLTQSLGQAAWGMLARMAPLMLGIAAVAVAANVVQFGFLATGEAVRLDFSRLSTTAGLRRMLSRRAMARIGFNMVKIAGVCVVGYLAVRQPLVRIMSAENSCMEMLGGLARAAGRGVLAVGVVLLAAAFGDFLYQRWQLRKDLKMTRREVLEELRRLEGTPELRSMRRKLASGRIESRIEAVKSRRTERK